MDTPEGLRATVCVAVPMVKTTLPVGMVGPLAEVTVAVSVYEAPAVSVPPLGVMESAVLVVITGTATVSLRVLEVLVVKAAVPW